jgi:glycosyltransferase involved in cell wall biosynthesis
MRILIVSQYFWPESFRINDLAVELLKSGHEVEVLTGVPNYPEGRFYKGYNIFSKRIELYKGVKIYRVPLFPRLSGTSVMLGLNYLSYVIFASLFVFFSRKKYDYTITFAVSPITQALPALLHKFLYKSKSIVWLQDIWPESVRAAGNVNNKYIYSFLEKLVLFIYRNTDKIMTQSRAFDEIILKKYNNKKKLFYFPYWAEDIYFDNECRDELKFSHLFHNGFRIIYAGNIGEAQDFDSIIKSAELLKDRKDIKWYIIGDGRKRKWLEEQITQKGLVSTVILLGKFPVDEMPNFFIHADAMLLSLKDEYIFSLTIPSKLQSYMASSKPILTMLNGIGSLLIEDSKSGFVANASDYKGLTNNIVYASSLPKSELHVMGLNAKTFYDQNFSKVELMKRMNSLLLNNDTFK